MSSKGSPTILPREVIRATSEEKERQIENLQQLHKKNVNLEEQMLLKLQETALANDNLFEQLMETAKYCSLGKITHAMFEVGGQYRRSM